MRDTVNVARLGVPCVGLIHDTFGKLAELQCKHLGMPNAPLLMYPQDQPSVDPHELTLTRARKVAKDAADFLLSPVPQDAVKGEDN